MDIREIKEEQEWREAAPDQAVDFLQSWDFGESLRRAGRSIVRLGGGEGRERWAVQGVACRVRGVIRYFYAPYASIPPKTLPDFCLYLQKQGYAFLRIEPVAALPDVPFPVQPAPPAQAQYRWIVDLAPSETDLLHALHQKTRYNIRLAERRGVTVTEEKNPDLFYSLDVETTKRKGYTSHGRNYYEAIVSSPRISQTIAWYRGAPVASAMLLTHHDTSIYLFGASSDEYRNTMAPTLLQWYNIRRAKQHGHRWYDFLGVAPPLTPEDPAAMSFHDYSWDTRHPYSRLTAFKAGFPGRVRLLPPACDIILRPAAYSLYTLLKKYRLA